MKTKLILITLLSILIAMGSIFLPSENYTLFVFAYLTVIAVYLLIKNRSFISREMGLQGLILAVLASTGELFKHNWGFAILIIVQVFLAYIAAMASFRANGHDYPFMRHNFLKSIGIILVVGIVLGAINTIPNLLNGTKMTLGQPFEAVLFAIRPGIWEEVFMRFLLFGLHVHLLGRIPESKTEHLITNIHMIVPHVLIHFAGASIGQAIIPIVFLCLFFGLPLTLLQKRVDLFTAIGSHFLVDWVRYFLFQM